MRIITLQKEDFQDFKVGAFPYDPEHSAMGEFHHYPPQGYRGNWYSPIADYNLKGPMWLIIKEGNKKIMESQVMERTRPWAWNVLVTGEELWCNYTLEAQVKMLNTTMQGGLAFRYQNSRCFYAICFENQQLKAIKKSHTEEIELVTQSFNCDFNKWYHLKVVCHEAQFSTYVDGKLVFQFKDPTFSNGRIAICGNGPIGFTDVLVSCYDQDYKLLQKKSQELNKELEYERMKYPQPKLWKRINLKDFGTGRNVRIGDLTGSGIENILLAQCQKRIFKDRYGSISCLTAIDLAGNVIWQLGEPNPDNAFITADLPFQIVDVDLDGQNEVIVVMDFKLLILEGKTGKIKKSIDTPLSEEPLETLYSGVPFDRYAFNRVNIDCIRICNFTGKAKPTDILIKDRYSRIWVYDNQLHFLWKYHDGITGHFPLTKDINADGKEEMVVGYNLVNAQGNKIWTLPVASDHTDEIIVGPLDTEREEELIGIVSGDEGFMLCDLKGNLLVKALIGHAQRISAGNYRPSDKGYEIAVTTYWGSQGIIFIYNGKGELLFSFEPGTNGNLITPVDWTGTGQDLILLNGNVAKGGLIDGYGRQVVVFPNDGHPELCAEVVQFNGNQLDKIVLWDQFEMFIYTQDKNVESGQGYDPEKYPQYNGSNYRGEYSFSNK